MERNQFVQELCEERSRNEELRQKTSMLEAQVLAKTQETQDFSNSLANKTAEFEQRLSESSVQHQHAMIELEMQLSLKDQKISDQTDTLELKISSLEAEVERKNAGINEMTMALAERSQTHAEESAGFAEKLEAARLEIGTLTQTIQSLRSNLDQKNEEVESLVSRLEKREAEMGALLDQNSAECNRKVEELHQANEQQVSSLRIELQTAVSSLEAEVERKNADLKAMSMAMSEKTLKHAEERQDFAEKLEAARLEIGTLTQTIQSLGSSLDQKSEEVQSLVTRLEKREAEMAAAMAQNTSECNRKIMELQEANEQQLVSLRNELEAEQSKIVDEFSAQILTLQTEVSERDAEAENLKELIAQKTVKLEEVQVSAASAKSELEEELAKARSNLDREIENSMVKDEDYKKRLGEMTSQVELLSSKLEESQRNFESVSSQQAEDYRRKCEEASALVQTSDESLAAERSRFVELRTRAAGLESQLLESRKSETVLASMLEEKTGEVGQVKHEAEVLGVQLSDQIRRNGELSAALEALKQSHTEKNSELQKLMARISDLEGLVKNQREEHDVALRDQCDDLRRRHGNDLESLASSYEQKISETRRSLEEKIGILETEKSSVLEKSEAAAEDSEKRLRKLEEELESANLRHRDELDRVAAVKDLQIKEISDRASTLEYEKQTLASEVERLVELARSHEGLALQVQEEISKLRLAHDEVMQRVMTEHESKIQVITNDFTTKISELDLSNQRHVCTIEQLSVALTEKTETLATVEHQAKEVNSDRAQLFDRLQRAEAQEKFIAEKVADLEKQLQEKGAEIETLSAGLASKASELDLARQAETTLRRDLETDQAEVQQRLEAHQAKVEAELSKKNEELSSLASELSAKTAAFEELKKSSMEEIAQLRDSIKNDREAALLEQRNRYQKRTEEVRS